MMRCKEAKKSRMRNRLRILDFFADTADYRFGGGLLAP